MRVSEILSTHNIAELADMKDAGLDWAGQDRLTGPQWLPGCRMKSTLRRSPCK